MGISDKDLEKIMSTELLMWTIGKLLVTLTGSRRGRTDLDTMISEGAMTSTLDILILRC